MTRSLFQIDLFWLCNNQLQNVNIGTNVPPTNKPSIKGVRELATEQINWGPYEATCCFILIHLFAVFILKDPLHSADSSDTEYSYSAALILSAAL